MKKTLLWLSGFAALFAFQPAAFAQTSLSTLTLAFGPQKQFTVECLSFRLNSESSGSAATGGAAGRSVSTFSCRAPVDDNTPHLILAAREHVNLTDAKLDVAGANAKGRYAYTFVMRESQLVDVALTRIALPTGQGGDVAVDIQIRAGEVGIAPLQYGQTPTGKPIGNFNPNQNRQR